MSWSWNYTRTFLYLTVGNVLVALVLAVAWDDHFGMSFGHVWKAVGAVIILPLMGLTFDAVAWLRRRLRVRREAGRVVPTPPLSRSS